MHRLNSQLKTRARSGYRLGLSREGLVGALKTVQAPLATFWVLSHLLDDQMILDYLTLVVAFAGIPMVMIIGRWGRSS